MSSNNQILVKKHKGYWYVFDDIMAESWSEKNELSLGSADGRFTTKENAIKFAETLKLDRYYPDIIEYGVVVGKLIKDDASVTIKGEEE